MDCYHTIHASCGNFALHHLLNVYFSRCGILELPVKTRAGVLRQPATEGATVVVHVRELQTLNSANSLCGLISLRSLRANMWTPF